MKNFISLIILAFYLTSCISTNEPAPVEYHNKYPKYNKKIFPNIEDKGFVNLDQKNIYDNEYAIPEKKPSDQDYKIIYHEVQVGETIEEIAEKYNKTINEIASINNLIPPYYLDEFEIIKIRVKNIRKKSIAPILTQKKTSTKQNSKKFISPLPIDGKILTNFGEKTNYGVNKGINISAKPGTKILSSTSGKVIYSDYDATFGYLVIVKIDQGNTIISYAHMEDLVLSKGDNVKQGDVIGYVGNTGKVTQAQLHFAIRDGKTVKNPLDYLSD